MEEEMAIEEKENNATKYLQNEKDKIGGSNEW